MKHILFVDDDENVLAGLRNRLRPQRARWELKFVQSGYEALEELELTPFDVVISDMRMPGMGGPELLARVKERYPDVARIVLSGEADREAVLRARPIAHQFLTKPCDGNVLRLVIERACALRAILCDDGLRGLIGRLDPLPSPPPLYRELAQAARAAHADGAELWRMLEADAGLSAAVTRLASDAGLDSPPALTPELLQCLTLAAALFALTAGNPSLVELPARAVRAARIARRLVADRRQADGAFAAALLRELGQIILSQALPERARLVDPLSVASDDGSQQRQRTQLDTTVTDLSAYCASQWSISPAVVEAVAFLHRADLSAIAGSELLTAVQVADALVATSDPAARDAILSARAGDALSRWSEIVAEELGTKS